MTENNGNSTESDSGMAPDDPRIAAALAVKAVRGLAENVTPEQLDLPTPSADYTVRQLLGHIVCAFQRLEQAGRMDPDVDWAPIIVEGIADDGYPAALEQAAHQIMERWTDASLLEQMVTLPFAQMPGAHAVGMYAGEYLTHAWDLAVATGQSIEWPSEVAAGCVAGMKMALPPEPRGGEIPFEAPVAIADDAPAIEQLVAWSGRNPQDWPSAIA